MHRCDWRMVPSLSWRIKYFAFFGHLSARSCFSLLSIGHEERVARPMAAWIRSPMMKDRKLRTRDKWYCQETEEELSRGIFPWIKDSLGCCLLYIIMPCVVLAAVLALKQGNQLTTAHGRWSGRSCLLSLSWKTPGCVL